MEFIGFVSTTLARLKLGTHSMTLRRLWLVSFIVAAVFFSFSIILHTVGWFVNSEKKKNIYIAEGALDLIGGILTFCGMIAYTVLIILGYLGLSWYFAWAYSACWASAVLYILAGSFEIVAGNTKPKQQVDPQQQQGQYISSSQYQTTSVTQSGGGYQNPVAQSSVPPTQALYKDPPQRQSRVNYAY
ncbi:uncharacterized protein LOC143460292 [Clavelina lepadiformis]|uniref:uncharacterized protein LOC143460292 n=1 Tax=Clavelina lepadiformis TaxID=159417 RepID=UPI0040413AC3